MIVFSLTLTPSLYKNQNSCHLNNALLLSIYMTLLTINNDYNSKMCHIRYRHLDLSYIRICLIQRVSEYDHEIPPLHTADQPNAWWGRATEQQQTHATSKTNKVKQPVFSHTRSGYPLFLPMWDISFSHVSVPAIGKDKNEQPHVVHTLAARRSVTSLEC